MKAALEVERKFLVAHLPDLSAARAEVIRQGYLTGKGDSVEIRLRQKGDRFFQTLKKGSGLERLECETEISQAQFEQFWPASKGQRLEKARWTGTLPDGHVFELDIFDGALAGFKLVEVEFGDTTEARAFEPPNWFGRDVTSDPAFFNAMLASEGLPYTAK
jgi:CYTH domain-containing protein